MLASIDEVAYAHKCIDNMHGMCDMYGMRDMPLHGVMCIHAYVCIYILGWTCACKCTEPCQIMSGCGSRAVRDLDWASPLGATRLCNKYYLGAKRFEILETVHLTPKLQYY